MRKILAIVLVGLMSIFAGCGDDSATPSGGGNGKLSVMFNANIVSLDSAQPSDTASFEVIADCIDGLMQLDSTGNVTPAIAESIDVSDDGKTYIFHLRDAKWANGEDVTANDFVFAWRRHCQLANEYAYIFGNTVACIKNADAVIKGADPTTLGVSATDSKTLVVELNAPVSFFLSLMAFPTFYPINENFYNSLPSGSYGTSPETFLSNGAFVLTEYLPGGKNVQLKKNDSYWNADRVTLDAFQYQVVSSSDNALTAFKNGTLNVAGISGNQIEYVKKDPELSKNLHVYPTATLNYLSFNQDAKNHHGGTLANVNLRLAIANAIDRESLVTNYVMTGAKATYTAVPVDFAPNFETEVYFSADQKQFADVVGFDVEKARNFLELAKAELGQSEFDLDLIFSNDSGDTSAKVVQAIKSQLEENLPGVKINLQPTQKAEYLKDVTSNNFDLALVDWIADYNDPMSFLTLWTTNNNKDTEHWSNADYDSIIENCTVGEFASNYNARWSAMYDAETILLNNAVITPLYTDANNYLISPNVTGIDFHSITLDRVFKNAKFQ